MNSATTIEIPADARDNSQTVTDYAFMRHRNPNKGATPTLVRDTAIVQTGRFGYTHFEWWDTNPDGQRCHFDLITDQGEQVVHLFHTEFFTRVACEECSYSYAGYYQVLTTQGGASDPVPRCDEHADRFRHAVAGTPGVKVRESERLYVGQH